MSRDTSAFSPSKLAPFAGEFAQRLFRVHPEWLSHAQPFNAGSCPDEEPLDGYDLLVEVPAPHVCNANRLVVQTDSALGYVVVGLGPASAELADWHQRGLDGLFSKAIDLIEGILSGRYVGVRLATGLITTDDSMARDDVVHIVSWTDREGAPPHP